jgi:ABC-type transporter Mla MlaB component
MAERQTSPGPELLVSAEADPAVTLLCVAGRLSIASAPVLRTAVRDAITGCPEVVLIDISAVEVVDDSTLIALPMFARQGAAVGTAVMVLRPPAALLQLLEGLAMSHQVRIVGSRAEALADVARQFRRAERSLTPVPGATAQARRLLAACCARWRLGHLNDVAALIVTELVANAIRHARTGMTLSVTLQRHHMRIAVRDGSPALPRLAMAEDALEAGRGLLIVEGLAAAWGYADAPGGKVVWATLRAEAGHATQPASGAATSSFGYREE